MILKEEQFIAQRDGVDYPASEMSDGERAALLLAGEVLTARDGALILLDEPELHLHPAIAASLLRNLLRLRSDCAFAVFTHDLHLPARESNIIVLRACTFGPAGTRWNADLLRPDAGIPEDAMRDVLGAREKIIFIEGVDGSLDLGIYSFVFPDATVIPRGGSQEVRKAVKAIGACQGIHWLTAAGIIDGDGLSPEIVNELAESKIFALPFFSVEGIYYSLAAQQAVVRLRGLEQEVLERAKEAVLQAASEAKGGLARDAAQRAATREAEAAIPRSADFSDNMEVVSIDPGSHYRSEVKRIEELIQNRNADLLLRRYNLKHGGICGAIATAIGFPSRAEYEAAVVEAVRGCPDFREHLSAALTPVRAAVGIPAEASAQGA